MIRTHRTVPALALAVAWSTVSSATATSAETAARLVIDYGDGVQLHFTSLTVKEKSTAIDLLKAGEKHARGIKSNVRGTAQTALVTSIDNVKNEGGGRDAKNWLYYVNDKRAEVGAGAYELQPKDVIMWKFETLRGEP